jgi:hypothetical protein
MLVCKAKVYAFLTSALSNSQKAFTENLIDSLFAQFVEDIAQGNFLWVKNIFHYFAEITNLDVLHQYTFISVLNILIKQAEKSSKIVKEELMLIILSVLPSS